MRDVYRFKETEILRECPVAIRLLVHGFVSDFVVGQINLWSPEGRHRGIVIVFCQRVGFSSNLDASQIVSSEEIEGLTAKVFRGDFDLIRINFSFRENCDFNVNGLS